MILGIVGGLSPEATSDFYFKLAEKARSSGHAYPHIVIDSVSYDFSLEDDMIFHVINQHKLLPVLAGSVNRLQDTDFIVVPCNTAHMFIGQLRKKSGVPIVSIVEEVTKRLKADGCKRAGLLATSSTIQGKVYSDKEIDFVSPPFHEQQKLSEIIVKIIRNVHTEDDVRAVQRIAEELRAQTDAVVLACTDLHRILRGDYIDSLRMLAEAVFERMEGDER